MIFGHDAAAAAERGDRRVQQFRQGLHLIGRMLRPGAAHDHRLLGGSDGSGGGLDGVGVEFWIDDAWRAAIQCHLSVFGHGVPAHFRGDRPRTTAARGLEGAVDDGRRIGWLADVQGILDEGPQGGWLIGQLVQVASAFSEELRRHLAGQADHWRAAAHGRQQRRGRVQDAGPRNDREGGWPTGRFGGAIGHVGGRLLVAGKD